jgi:hypothetical protein
MKVDWVSRTISGKTMWQASCSCVFGDDEFYFSNWYDNRSDETEQSFLVLASYLIDFTKNNK